MPGAMPQLERARARLTRLTPQQAHERHQAGRVRLIDVRMPHHRQAQGELPGAIVIDLTALPWRLDPTFEWRIPEADSWSHTWALVCRHGYSSSLAAALLQEIGLCNATDVIGGFEGWASSGLPVGVGPADVRD